MKEKREANASVPYQSIDALVLSLLLSSIDCFLASCRTKEYEALIAQESMTASLHVQSANLWQFSRAKERFPSAKTPSAHQ